MIDCKLCLFFVFSPQKHLPHLILLHLIFGGHHCFGPLFPQQTGTCCLFAQRSIFLTIKMSKWHCFTVLCFDSFNGSLKLPSILYTESSLFFLNINESSVLATSNTRHLHRLLCVDCVKMPEVINKLKLGTCTDQGRNVCAGASQVQMRHGAKGGRHWYE